ncbi:MAG TPA: hypothetical protein DCG49_11605 [Ruminococcus sp.]|nr:hypothetical protein [Ruminococcus sp.]
MKKWFMIYAAAMLLLTGCGRQGYADFNPPEQGASDLKPVADIYAERHYEGIAPTAEQAMETVETVITGDGACKIRCLKSYYDVTLDYSKGSPYEIGAAYAEAIVKVRGNYPAIVEEYLYENIKAAFPNLAGDYTAIEQRTNTICNALRKEYQDEIRGFADGICGDAEGFSDDGILSRGEAQLIQLVPDVLRGTACSALTADGSATASGARITSRILEWQLGSENQLCTMHTLMHIQNGASSFTSVTLFGIMSILTAINHDGVMMSILDVGSKEHVPYTTDDKRSYTYDIRYALEHCIHAREAAEFLRDNAQHYPYCVNVLCTDAEDACVAELSVEPDDGTPLLRDANTALHDGLRWDDPAFLCVVNSFAAKGNADQLTYNANNVIRWNRYHDLFCGQRGLTVSRYKELLTSEQLDNDLVRIRSGGVVHLVLADYDTRRLQAVFPDTNGIAETPEFIDLGSWET